MGLFCFKNVRFAKFIKQMCRMNIEFSKIGSDKVWEKKVEGHILRFPYPSVRISHCPVSKSASHNTSHLEDLTKDIFNEKIYSHPYLLLEKGRKSNREKSY